MLAATTTVAGTLFLATRFSDEPTAEFLYLTYITGALLSLWVIGFLRIADVPLFALLVTPFAWAAAMATLQNALLGGIAISPFTYATPSFDGIWRIGSPAMLSLLLLERSQWVYESCSMGKKNTEPGMDQEQLVEAVRMLLEKQIDEPSQDDR